MSHDFNYQAKAVAFDRHLETVMASHASSSTKEASSPDDAPIGLQQFVERPTISEEIAMIRSKAASAETDLNVIRAREKVASIVEDRASRFDNFSALAKPAVEHFDKVAAEEAAIEGLREEFKTAGTLRDLGRAAVNHPSFDAAASGAIVGGAAAGIGAAAKKLKKKQHED